MLHLHAPLATALLHSENVPTRTCCLISGSTRLDTMHSLHPRARQPVTLTNPPHAHLHAQPPMPNAPCQGRSSRLVASVLCPEEEQPANFSLPILSPNGHRSVPRVAGSCATPPLPRLACHVLSHARRTAHPWSHASVLLCDEWWRAVGCLGLADSGRAVPRRLPRFNAHPQG